jgi:hypothetical protein
LPGSRERILSSGETTKTPSEESLMMSTRRLVERLDEEPVVLEHDREL